MAQAQELIFWMNQAHPCLPFSPNRGATSIKKNRLHLALA